MKKRLGAILIIMLVLMITACGNSNSEEEPNGADSQIMENTDPAETRLTMEKVEELSEKGEALTWSDFEQYENSGDIGSGLYVIRYDMEEPYYVLVGGSDMETFPMYIRLVSTENPDNYIDIRTESIDDFVIDDDQEWKIESGSMDINVSSPIDGVTMEVTEYSNTSVTVRIINDTDMNIECGSDFHLNILDEETDEWRDLDTVVIDDYGFTAVAYEIQKDSPYEMVIDFEWLYGKLKPGRYQITKTVMVFRETGDHTSYAFTAEFDITF